MPVTLDQTTLRKAPDVVTGARSSQSAQTTNAEGVSNPPNDGQVMSTTVAEPNDAVTLDSGTLREAPQTAPTFDPTNDIGKGNAWEKEILRETPGALKQIGIGGLKSLGNTLYGLSTLIVPDKNEEQNRHVFDPSNPIQEVGRQAEQTGEFLVPGLGEEAATERAGKLAPLARIGYNSLTSGLLNKAQGGDFTTGAVAGGVGSGIAEGGKAVAPALAEGAMGIRKLDRAYGRRPGLAILDETRGFRPETVAASADERLGELTPQLESMVDAASTRPRQTPIKGLLPPPPTELLTGNPVDPDVPGELIPAAKFPTRNISVPEESTYIPVMPQRDAFMTSGTREAADLPRSGPGVLLRRPELEPFNLSPLEPNPIASLGPARSTVGDAMSKATQQNAGGTLGQLTPLHDFLHSRFDTGEAIPEMVTPRQRCSRKSLRSKRRPPPQPEGSAVRRVCGRTRAGRSKSRGSPGVLDA